jgi:hypothetical protein
LSISFVVSGGLVAALLNKVASGVPNHFAHDLSRLLGARRHAVM